MNTENANIEHVNSLNSIKKLESLGFEGTDADIATSLFEYGLAWKELEEDTIFVHAIRWNDNGDAVAFDRCMIASDTDARREWDWADWDQIESFTGMEGDEWDALPLAQKVADLIQYYGYENVFGESYWEGFTIAE